MIHSLRIRILITTVAVIVAALVINGAVSLTILNHHQDRQVATDLAAVAEGNGRAIDEWVSGHVQMIEALAPMATAEAPLSSLLQLQQGGGFLATYMAYPDTSDAVFSDGWEAPADYDPRGRSWFKQATAAERTVVTHPYVDANTGGLVVTFATPFYDDGRLVAVAGGDIAIDSVVSTVNAIAPTPDSFAFLVSEDGTLIAHPDSTLSLAPATDLSASLQPAFLATLGQSGAPPEVAIGDREQRLIGVPIDHTDWQLVVAMDVADAGAGVRQVTQASVITLVVVGGAAVLVLGGLLRMAFRRLDVARDAMVNVASGNGDLTRRLPEEGKDEVAQIAAAFNRFVARMESAMLTIRDSSESVRVAAGEIALGGQDLSRRSENAAASLQQTSASIEEITSTVSHTADSSRQANGLSRQASEMAGRNGEVVTQVVSTMEGITQSSEQIADIVKVMDGIAFQTNLLALNASVEAARAGEHGRGFAVVAGEVRQLANRSAEASREIRQLIDTSSERVSSGTDLVRQAGVTMEELVTQVGRVAESLGEISVAAEEQSDGITQINVAVSELDRMTQQNAALVEESTAAAERLKEQADRLFAVVGGFTLGGESRQVTPRDANALGQPGQTAMTNV